MIGDLPIQTRAAVVPSRPVRKIEVRWPAWQRRFLEALVAVASFAVWGKLAYVGFFRLYARWEGLGVRGSITLDVLSLLIGVAGSIAGISALWAVAMRTLGRTPASLIGAPDDSPEDWPGARRAPEPDGAPRRRRRES